ncbi:MAG: sulfotransferase family protein [Candidatus Heimdallarchaeaceae archaeon]
MSWKKPKVLMEVIIIFLMGSTFTTWIKLLVQNRFNISFKYIPKAFAITLVTFIFWPFALFEFLKFDKKTKLTEIKEPPIFIIGHWRTGTTHLQNLMLKDGRFGYMNLIEGTFPHMILTNYNLIKSFMSPLIPEKRPMDNMAMCAETPQEHEFALTIKTLMSPLTALFFPYNQDRYLKYDSFEEATEEEKEEWKDALKYFLQKLTIRYKGKRLLLKNPFDTFRIKLILDIFPEAKFINIYRDPYRVFFSTVKLHKTNTSLFWLQKPTYDLDEFIFTTYKKMYRQFYADYSLIPPGNIIEVKYEDLVTKPIEELEKIYKKLSLGDFQKIKPSIEDYLKTLKSYKVDKYKITLEDKKRIYSQWYETIDRWGYEKP